MNLRALVLPLLLLCFGAFPVVAQEEGADTPSEENGIVLEARAGSAQDVLVGDIVTFDASGSISPPDVNVSYAWSFGDGGTGTGERVTHTYRRPGSYTVQLRLRVGEEFHEDTTSVTVYEQEHVLLTDDGLSPEGRELLFRAAADEDILLTTIRPPAGGSTTIAEAIARQTLGERRSLERASLIFVSGVGTTGQDILTSLGQLLTADTPEQRRLLHMEEKGVILVTDQAFPLVARPAQTAFNVLRPQYILLTRPEALSALVRLRSADDVLTTIRTTSEPFLILGPHSERAVSRLVPWNALSYFVNALVNAGVPSSSIILILMLPIVATLLAFSRQIIGIKAFGIFTPAAVTLSFLALGLKYGLLVFLVVLLAATASRFLLRRFRLLYLPRMAIVLTAVSLAILALFGVGALTKQTGILAFSIFPILLLASLAEQFVEAQIRLGFRAAARLTGETLLLSIVSTLIADWETLRSFVVGFPEVILLTIPLNLLLGRWTGLRLTEYIRFRQLLTRTPKRP